MIGAPAAVAIELLLASKGERTRVGDVPVTFSNTLAVALDPHVSRRG
jgi:hypothetical protein